jgi:hypothetical protein
MPNWLARCPHAKQRGAPVGIGGIPGAAPQLPDQTEQAAPKKVTLSLRRGVGQVESSGRKRQMMDGKASKAVRSEIHSLEARGVSSAVWVWERAGHEGQGTSLGPEHPVNLSWVSAPDVRYC